MSYSGTDLSSSSSSSSSSNNQENIHETNSLILNNSNQTKRRSSMGSIPSINTNNIRTSLSPSRKPLRLRENVVDYKETSLRQKMRSSFYLIKKIK
jgi:hypothetical protein